MLPRGSGGKESTHNAGDLGSIPGLGRSPGEGKDYPLQYSSLENSMDCTVHGVAKSQTQLSDFHSTSSSTSRRAEIESVLGKPSIKCGITSGCHGFLPICEEPCRERVSHPLPTPAPDEPLRGSKRKKETVTVARRMEGRSQEEVSWGPEACVSCRSTCRGTGPPLFKVQSHVRVSWWPSG